MSDIFDKVQSAFQATYSLTAGAKKYIEQGGRWITLLNCNFAAQFKFENGAIVPARPGMVWTAKFTHVEILCPSDTTVSAPSFTVLLGDGVPPDLSGREDAVDFISPISDVVVGANSLAGPISGGAGCVALHVATAENAANAVRLGDNTTSSSKGFRLKAGGERRIAGNGDLYVFNPGAASVTVTIMAEVIR